MARKINSLSDESLQKLKRELQKVQNTQTNRAKSLTTSVKRHEAVWMPTPNASVRGYGGVSYTASQNTSSVDEVVPWTRHEEHKFLPCDQYGYETDDGPYFKALKNCKCLLFCHMTGRIPELMPAVNPPPALNSIGTFRLRRKRESTDYRHVISNLENQVRIVGHYMVSEVNESAGLVTSIEYKWMTNAGLAGDSTHAKCDVSTCISFHAEKDDIYYFKFARSAMPSDFGSSLITFEYDLYFQLLEIGSHSEFEYGSISDYESNWENIS